MNTITKRWLCMLVVMAMVLSMSPVITLPAAAAVTNPGAVYGGLPYVTSSFGNLYKAMEFYDPETGTLDVSGGNTTFKTIGNQCSSSTFWAWNRVCASLTYQGTSDAVLNNGCIPVGPYTYDTTADDFNTVDTHEICNTNGAQTMYESYAKVEPADGLVHAYAGSGGHMRMVAGSVNVVRNSDGTINGAKSTLVYLDQIASWSDSAQTDGTADEIDSGADVVVTFEELFNTGYIPFTIAELNKTASVQAGEASLNLNGQNVSASTLSWATLSSNYAISNIEVVVKNAGGEEVYSNTTLTYGLPREYAMSSTFDATAVAALAGDGVTIEVNVRIGSGELITAYTGSLTA